ncbi:MAG: AMP-binding protein [Pseudomonadota bacterium]
MTQDSLHPPAGTIRDWLDRRADESPDAPAYHFTDDATSLTWADLRGKAHAIAASLTSSGTDHGESVAIMMPNGRPAVEAFFGAVYGGFRATMINLAAGDTALAYALDHCEATHAFVGPSQRDQFDRVKPARMAAFEPGDGPAATLHPVGPDDMALLMYTSGTTGVPKGVLHSHASLMAGGWTTAIAHDLRSDDVGYCVLPICHINGLCVSVMGTLISGSQMVMAPKFSNQQFWPDIEAHNATWFSVVPTIISHLLHSDTAPTTTSQKTLRFGRSASAPLAPEVQSAFEDRFSVPIVETMGLTETAAQILSNPLPPGPRKIGSPGVAFGNEVCIRGPDNDALPPGQEGELLIKGPNVMRGYLKNEAETAKAMTADGWLRSGDLARMDADGYIFVTGRLKELIIKGGENIAPREIDEALYANADVVEAAAFAVPCPTYGEEVHAAVTLRPDTSISSETLRDACIARLGQFKAPATVHILPELPKGPSGKIQRLKLTETFK